MKRAVLWTGIGAAIVAALVLIAMPLALVAINGFR